MNAPRQTSEFSDFPWRPEDCANKPGAKPGLAGAHPHAAEAHCHLKARCDEFNLSECFQLQTKVQAIARGQGNKGWIATIHAKAGEAEAREFDNLIMCAGRFMKPTNPLRSESAGAPSLPPEQRRLLGSFAGKVVRSSALQGLAAGGGQRVLCVGGAASGAGTAAGLARRGQAAALVNSARRAPRMLNRFSKDGRTSDEATLCRLMARLLATPPESINNKGLQSAALENYPLQVMAEISGDPALAPHPDIATAGASYAHDWVELMRDQKLTLKGAIQSAEGKTVGHLCRRLVARL